jgi:2,5-diamino-6-(ribosylamino)-4(3H)-pyrimidinone 5'-phosphate reductase
MRRVQRIRSASDAILVGVGTVIKDNPSLKVHWELLGIKPKSHRTPIRVVIDSNGRTPKGAKVMDGSAPTAIITAEQCKRAFPTFVHHASFGNGHVDIRMALEWLSTEFGVRKLMVEGGSRIITSFINEGLADRITVFVAPVLIGGITAPSLMAGADCRDEKCMVKLHLVGVKRLDDGVLLDFKRK